MAIQLYKKGNTHRVKGINCKILNCRSDSLAQHLKKGYVLDPTHLDPKVKAAFDAKVKKDAADAKAKAEADAKAKAEADAKAKEDAKKKD